MKTPAALVCLILTVCGGAQAATPTPALGAAAPAVRIGSFTPQGYMRGVRQVQVRFDQDMVALGDPRVPDPFTIRCPVTGHGHWADSRNWEYDFDSDLEGGITCRFTVLPTVTTLAGGRLTGPRQFSFNTGGPAIRTSLPADGWEELSEDQVFILKLDAAARTSSINEHAWCDIDGIVERVPVQVIEGPERTAILAQSRLLSYSYYQLLWKAGEVTHARVRNTELTRRESLLMLLRCQRRLPPGTRIALHWGAGIAAPGGLTTREEQQLSFRVRPAFTATVECTRTNPRAGCVPTLPITVSFSAPVPSTFALGARLVSASGKAFTPDVMSGVPFLQSVTFTGPFPEHQTLQVQLPAQLVDDAGRKLANAARFPLSLALDTGPPLVKFSGEFGILEAREGGVLPVTVRNVEPRLSVRVADLPAKVLRVPTDPSAIVAWLKRVERSQESSGEWVDEGARGARRQRVWRQTTGSVSVFRASEHTTGFTLKAPQASKPAQVIGIPLRKPGLYVVEIASPILGATLLGPGQTRYVATAALVTDLAVHLQWGEEASVVWVTQLSTGKPVPEAQVLVSACAGSALWQGVTDAQGIARIERGLGHPDDGSGGCRWGSGIIAMAHTDTDMSFVLSGWSRGITPWDFSVPYTSEVGNALYHTVFDRSLFRAGELVSMRHIIRRHVLNGMAIPANAHGTFKVEIIHAASGDRYSQDVTFDAQGTGSSEFRIPANAPLGTYYVSIDSHGSGTFTVAQFRLPSMRGAINGPTRALVGAKSVDLNVHVEYLSGGGAAGLPVKVRTLIEPQTVSFAEWPDYTFGGEAVQPGLHSRDDAADDADSDAEEPAAGVTDEDDNNTPGGRAQTLPLTLDATGSAHLILGNVPKTQRASQLTAELEYSDANGQSFTASTRVSLSPASMVLGLKADGWAGTRDQLRFRVLAVDLDGKALAGRSITVHLYRVANYSYRKRLIGGFYAYESATDTQSLAPRCAGVTDEHGLLLCNLAPGVSGEILVRAETRTPEGVTTGATSSMWSLGAAQQWFGGTSADRMDLLPEKPEYSTGDIARFQVRMPFRTATALVSVQREGVIRSFVTTLKGDSPVVEVPIEAVDSPNIFVSVLAVRGRVRHTEQPPGTQGASDEVTALVDLTKPAYRMGMAQIKVDWKPHRLLVRVAPQADVMKVRQTAQVHIHVSAEDGTPLPVGTQVTVAAVDEALLELKPNDSWDLLTAMMRPRGLQVWTATAQMQVVGKRHYGRKAVAHGGGGGRSDSARELFDTVLLWKDRVRLDANGEASVAVPLNDSLSSFRIVAIAQAGAQKFGMGSATLRTTQDLILLSGLPPLVREADHYAATFTVRNTTDHAITTQLIAKSAALMPHEQQQTLQIAAGLSTAVHLAAIAPMSRSHIEWDVAVRATDAAAEDHLKVSQQLIEAVPVRTYQATLADLAEPLSLHAARPQGALPGRGGLNITVQNHLAGSLDGVREYLNLYPYRCMEQQVSRAVGLDDRAAWDQVMQGLPQYLDEDGLLRYFLSEWLPGDDTLTAYVLSMADARGWPVPQESQQRMTQALKEFVAGRVVRYSALPTADLAIRKLAAIEALSRYQQATPDMLDSIKVEPALLPTSALLDLIGILQRLPQIPEAAARTTQAFQILKSRLNFQGTTLTFSTDREDALWWLMISEDSNANRLLLAAMTRADWADDVPRLVRGALLRQQHGHWNTTVANAWGVLAMARFTDRFEATPVTGATRIRYGDAQRTIDWNIAPRAAASSTTGSHIFAGIPALGGPQRQVALAWNQDITQLTVEHTGTGAPWVMVRARAAVPLTMPFSSGFRIKKTLSVIEQQHPGQWTRGDVLRVHLDLDAQSDMTWVALEDPVPAGATILGSGLGGDAQLLRRGSQTTGAAWLAFREMRFDSFRAFYRFVPKGRWSVEYTVRLDNPGSFNLPATRIEAMYAPEMLGELPNASMTVFAAQGAP